MELAQKYIDLLQPPAIMSKRELAEKQGWSKGVAFNGSRAIEFLYRDGEISTSYPADPIYRQERQVGFIEHVPSYALEMEILLDDNEVFMMFNKPTLPLDIRFEAFMLEGAVSESFHPFQSAQEENIISKVRFNPIRSLKYI